MCWYVKYRLLVSDQPRTIGVSTRLFYSFIAVYCFVSVGRGILAFTVSKWSPIALLLGSYLLFLFINFEPQHIVSNARATSALMTGYDACVRHIRTGVYKRLHFFFYPFRAALAADGAKWLWDRVYVKQFLSFLHASLQGTWESYCSWLTRALP